MASHRLDRRSVAEVERMVRGVTHDPRIWASVGEECIAPAATPLATPIGPRNLYPMSIIPPSHGTPSETIPVQGQVQGHGQWQGQGQDQSQQSSHDDVVRELKRRVTALKRRSGESAYGLHCLRQEVGGLHKQLDETKGIRIYTEDVNEVAEMVGVQWLYMDAMAAMWQAKEEVKLWDNIAELERSLPDEIERTEHAIFEAIVKPFLTNPVNHSTDITPRTSNVNADNSSLNDCSVNEDDVDVSLADELDELFGESTLRLPGGPVRLATSARRPRPPLALGHNAAQDYRNYPEISAFSAPTPARYDRNTTPPLPVRYDESHLVEEEALYSDELMNAFATSTQPPTESTIMSIADVHSGTISTDVVTSGTALETPARYDRGTITQTEHYDAVDIVDRGTASIQRSRYGTVTETIAPCSPPNTRYDRSTTTLSVGYGEEDVAASSGLNNHMSSDAAPNSSEITTVTFANTHPDSDVTDVVSAELVNAAPGRYDETVENARYGTVGETMAPVFPPGHAYGSDGGASGVRSYVTLTSRYDETLALESTSSESRVITDSDTHAIDAQNSAERFISAIGRDRDTSRPPCTMVDRSTSVVEAMLDNSYQEVSAVSAGGQSVGDDGAMHADVIAEDFLNSLIDDVTSHGSHDDNESQMPEHTDDGTADRTRTGCRDKSVMNERGHARGSSGPSTSVSIGGRSSGCQSVDLEDNMECIPYTSGSETTVSDSATLVGSSVADSGILNDSDSDTPSGDSVLPCLPLQVTTVRVSNTEVITAHAHPGDLSGDEIVTIPVQQRSTCCCCQ